MAQHLCVKTLAQPVKKNDFIQLWHGLCTSNRRLFSKVYGRKEIKNEKPK